MMAGRSEAEDWIPAACMKIIDFPLWKLPGLIIFNCVPEGPCSRCIGIIMSESETTLSKLLGSVFLFLQGLPSFVKVLSLSVASTALRPGQRYFQPEACAASFSALTQSQRNSACEHVFVSPRALSKVTSFTRARKLSKKSVASKALLVAISAQAQRKHL